MSARYSIGDIDGFLLTEKRLPADRMRPDADLCRDLGVEGEDFIKLMDHFRAKFGVEMSGYRWYFHHGDEVVGNPFSLIFRPRTGRSRTYPSLRNCC
jgi:hypothetical protein